MTYPKVSHTDATTVASSPRFPAIEEAVPPGASKSCRIHTMLLPTVNNQLNS